MTNYEILKECKQAYEILQDLSDNCEYIEDDNKIKECIWLMESLYNKAYDKENNVEEMGEEVVYCETLKPKNVVCCPHCGKEMYVSDIIGYAYVCINCDENFYTTECEVGSAWWEE